MRPDLDDQFLDLAARSHMRSIRREIEDAARDAAVVERFRCGVEMLVLAGCGDRIADLADEFASYRSTVEQPTNPQLPRFTGLNPLAV